MDEDAIFQYLAGEMDILLFPDYLKRYIYEKAEIDAPFREIPDSVYAEIISASFADNDAPIAFSPTKARKNAVIKRWLSQSSAKRETVFIMGFGLKMTAADRIHSGKEA